MIAVSFKVAKALKEAGYPQDDLSVWYDSNGVIFTIHPRQGTEYYVAPSYIEVWLWLWREKKVDKQHLFILDPNEDPEEAIVAAIDAALEYLTKNKKEQ